MGLDKDLYENKGKGKASEKDDEGTVASSGQPALHPNWRNVQRF